MVEIEFHISRSRGLVGVHFDEVKGRLVVSSFSSPCLAEYFGLLEKGDVLLAVDEKVVKTENDLISLSESVAASYSKDDMSLKIERKGKKGPSQQSQHGIEGDVIVRSRDLIKKTAKTDHSNQAKLRLQIGEVLLARGDYIEAQDVLEDALNIAYGINIGVNPLVVTCYGALSQVYYCQGKFESADEALNEAEGVIKKLGTSQDTFYLEMEIVNKKAEVAKCRDQEDEMLHCKTRSAELLKIILSLQVSAAVLPCFRIMRLYFASRTLSQWKICRFCLNWQNSCMQLETWIFREILMIALSQLAILVKTQSVMRYMPMLSLKV